MGRLERLRKNLFAAIDKHNLEEVKKYVKKAKKINRESEIINGERYGMRPIHHAVYVNNLEALRFLLHNNAEINAISHMCFNPFLYISTMNNKIKKTTHDCYSNNNSGVMQGFTALHLAFFYCRLDIAKLLLRNKNIDINIKNMNDKTAFDVIGGYYNLGSGRYTIQEILSITANNITEAECEAKLTSIKAGIKAELDANGTTGSASSAASLSLSPTKAIKTELEISNTKDLASSTVNSFSTPTRADFKEASSITSSAVKPSSFINNIFSWITASTLGRNTPALPPAQQSVDHLDGSPIGSSQVDCNGTILLTAAAISKFIGKKYSMPLDDSLLTIQEIREIKLNTIEKNLEVALSECKRYYQCPESSLSNLTISKGMHQKSL